MKRFFPALALLLLFAGHSKAQVNNQLTGAGAPSGSCTSTQTYLDTTAHIVYFCNNAAWVAAGSTPQSVGSITSGAGAPTGACTANAIYINSTVPTVYACNASLAWASTGGGGGTVTGSSLTSGNVITGAGSSAIQDGGTALSALATLASPTFTGTVTLPTVTNTGVFTNSTAGATSAPAMTLTGIPFAGTGTTSFPLFYVNTAGSGQPGGLSTGGTLIGANSASGFAGNLLGLYNNGTLEFTVSSAGAVTTNGNVNAAAASAICFNGRSCFKSPVDGILTPLLNGGNGGIVHSPSTGATGSLIQVGASGFTTAANTNLQAITGLTWNVPISAQNYSFTCHLVYSQATGVAAVAFGIQAATNSPTNIFATGLQQITVGPPATFVTGTLPTLATTTATNIVSGTPGATATNYYVDLGGTFELGASANALNIMVSTATSGDAVTVLRGSNCQLY